MNKNRKFTTTLRDAKKLYKLKTGVEFGEGNEDLYTRIFRLKIMRTKTRRYFVGSYMEWLNL